MTRVKCKSGEVIPNAGGTADTIDYPSRNIGNYVPGLFAYEKIVDLEEHYEHRKHLPQHNFRQTQ